jgi:NAD(P)H-binding
MYSRDAGHLLPGASRYLFLRINHNGVARGLIRARESHEGVEIDLAGVGLTLLTLGPEEITVEGERVTCRYLIRGLLSGAAGGRAGGGTSRRQFARALRRRERLLRPPRASVPAAPAPPARLRQPPVLPEPATRGSGVTVAVLGASGVIGRALVPALAGDEEVVAVSRHAQQHDDSRVRSKHADVTDPDSIRYVLEGVDVLYYLVHSLGTPDFAELDRRGASVVAREAEASGVRQIVYLGAWETIAATSRTPSQPRGDRDRARFGLRACHHAPCSRRRRAGKRGLRDRGGTRRPLACDDRAEVGVDPDAADRPRRRRPLSRRRRAASGRDRVELRRRRAGGPDLQADDRAHRPAPRAPSSARGPAASAARRVRTSCVPVRERARKYPERNRHHFVLTKPRSRIRNRQDARALSIQPRANG